MQRTDAEASPAQVNSGATPTFPCSICGEPAIRICLWCTKDACDNHLCTKCQRCSDCCECELVRVGAEESS